MQHILCNAKKYVNLQPNEQIENIMENSVASIDAIFPRLRRIYIKGKD